MTPSSTDEPKPRNPERRQPLRLWPGVSLAILLVVLRYGAPLVAPDNGLLIAFLGGAGVALLIVLWWLFASRAPWVERLAAVALVAVALVATPSILHESIAKGNMSLMFPFFSLPFMALALVAWAAATRGFSRRLRLLSLVGAIALVCGVFALLRTGGNDTAGDHDFAWRWSPTPEELLLAEAGTEPIMATTSVAGEDALAADAEPAEWPGFRGAERDGVVRGVRIATDWTATPPVELWRQPVGPGWSSFAVAGEVIYTQEQRGDDEAVAAYSAATGEPVWRHHDTARFWESVGGPGPRGTPSLHGGRVYTLGGTGVVNALEAADGSVVWSRDSAADTGAEPPYWGFSGSPLVTDELVVVAASGSLIAYDRTTGETRWTGPSGGDSYSSPQLSTLGGVEQILLLNGDGVSGVTPADGSVLWQHEWKGYPIVQPAVAAGNVLISVSDRSGIKAVAVEHVDGGWTTTERWTTQGLKPYFNDFVIHQGHAYGFDGRILSCIDLETGDRQWKGGRYGGGQLVLLADQDLLLVLSEDGELALVSAQPDGYTELARVPAIESKTWNHPVVAGDVVYVRNAQEMAAFRLPTNGA